MKIELWAVGKTRISWVREAENDYLKRCRRFAQPDMVILPPEKSSDPKRIVTNESTRILDRLGRSERAYTILLDEKGTAYTSAGFASMLQNVHERQGGRVRFLIGGAYGVSDEVKSAVDVKMALSKMTFPHEFVRIVFLEQLYRAFTILRGESYHHE